MEKLLYTERETIDRLNLPRTSLRREMAKGRIQPIRIGRAVRFAAVELDRYVAALETQATAELEAVSQIPPKVPPKSP